VRRLRAAVTSRARLELSSLDLGEIGNAAADQADYDHRWLMEDGRV
jgi:hypothetical protein